MGIAKVAAEVAKHPGIIAKALNGLEKLFESGGAQKLVGKLMEWIPGLSEGGAKTAVKVSAGAAGASAVSGDKK